MRLPGPRAWFFGGAAMELFPQARKKIDQSRFHSISQIEYRRNFVFKRDFPNHKLFELRAGVVAADGPQDLGDLRGTGYTDHDKKPASGGGGLETRASPAMARSVVISLFFFLAASTASRWRSSPSSQPSALATQGDQLESDTSLRLILGV